MKWKKLSGINKWIGYLDGKHVASFLFATSDDSGRVWIDNGQGFQRVHLLSGEPMPRNGPELKAVAELAICIPISRQVMKLDA